MSTRIAPTSVDLRQAVRRLRKRPGFSLLVIAVLGLGLGAASTIFSLRYAVLMRPLPLLDADRLVEIRTVSTRPEADVFGASEQDAADWQERSSAIEVIGTYSTGRVNVLTENRADSVAKAHVTPGFFTALGVQPLIGRTFLPEEDVPGGHVAKAVISHGIWQTLFAGRADVLGQTLRTDQGNLEIVGVAAPELTFPKRTQVWIPAQSIYDVRGSDRTDPARRSSRRWVRSVARLADHASLGQAQASLDGIGRLLQAEYPKTNAEMMPEVISLRAAETERLRPYLALLSGAALLMLVICCANVSSLMMMRALRRRRELAVRWALGAGLQGLSRTLLVESLVLSVAGGLLALALTALALRFYPSLVPVALPSWFEARLDPPVILFTFAVALGSCLLVALAPLWRALRGAPSTELREGTKGSARQSRWRPALVVAQITLCFLLLTAAALLQRSLTALESVDHGLHPERVMTVVLSPFHPGINEERIRGVTRFYRNLIGRLEQIPGVVAVGGTDNFPFSGSQYGDRGGVTVEARGQTEEERRMRAPTLLVDVTPNYFEAVGLPLLEGRTFNDGDTFDSAKVIILSERGAKELFPDRPALGQEVRIAYDGGGADEWASVVGVVGDVKYDQRWDDRGVELYYPHSQYGLMTTHLAIRTRGSARGLEEAVRKTIAEVAPETAVERVGTLERMIDDALWQDRLWSAVFNGFSMMALLLAAVGIYGVLAESVAQRTREMGIRMALGALPRDVVSRVARQGLLLVVVGLLAGWAAMPLIARALEAVVFGVEATTQIASLSAVLALLATALLACLLPAVRAARDDPLEALRDE